MFQISLLEPDVLKSDPLLDIPLKKSKLVDEYAAYLYAAIDPLYMHAALYEQWSNRTLSAFRPVPNLFAKEGKSRHIPSSLGGRYKEPPLLQNPERVVSLSESEKFERSFQPNVALAPPKKQKYKGLDLATDDYVKESPDATSVITSKEYTKVPTKLQHIERTHSAIVDSTVSVVQSTAQQRYNSEIELSTDTDDSLSDTSGDNLRKLSDVQRVAEALTDASEEMKERVLDLVRNITKEHSRVIQQCQEKDERIRQLEQKIKELQTEMRQPEDVNDSGSRQSEYDVSSSRAEIPAEESSEIETINVRETSPDVNTEVSVEMVTSCGGEEQQNDCEQSVITDKVVEVQAAENNNSVILAISPSSEKVTEATKMEVLNE